MRPRNSTCFSETRNVGEKRKFPRDLDGDVGMLPQVPVEARFEPREESVTSPFDELASSGGNGTVQDPVETLEELFGCVGSRRVVQRLRRSRNVAFSLDLR